MAMNGKRTTLTAADLDHVIIRVEFDDGHWGYQSARAATDKQFNRWVVEALYESHLSQSKWSESDRVAYCTKLYRGGLLNMCFDDSWKGWK